MQGEAEQRKKGEVGQTTPGKSATQGLVCHRVSSGSHIDAKLLPSHWTRHGPEVNKPLELVHIVNVQHSIIKFWWEGRKAKKGKKSFKKSQANPLKLYYIRGLNIKNRRYRVTFMKTSRQICYPISKRLKEGALLD